MLDTSNRARAFEFQPLNEVNEVGRVLDHSVLRSYSRGYGVDENGIGFWRLGGGFIKGKGLGLRV